jgi:hypothetical protein
MRVGRSEALDILSKWLSERALLRCDISFSEFAACFRGRIVSLTDGRVHVLCDDTFSELDLPLTPNLNFGYGEPRYAPDNLEFSGTLIVFIAELPSNGDVDTVCFLEVVES